MDNLITKDGALSTTVSVAIAEFEKKIKELKAQEDELKEQILSEMQAHNLIKLETDDLVISYVDSYDKESFDKNKLKEDYPKLYDEYIKMSTVKPSIRIKVK